MEKTNNTFPPIALFAYNRPDHTERAITSILENKLSYKCDIHIYSDGPKNIGNKNEVQKVRHIIEKYKKHINYSMYYRKSNIGLANSIIGGVNNLVKKYGTVVVIEDDLELSPYFIKYMHEALQKYRNRSEVVQISGFAFDTKVETDYDAIFLPFTTSWGWGTWERAWNQFDCEMKYLIDIEKSPELKRKFNINNNYDYYTMAVKTKLEKFDSWAIKWYLSTFRNYGLTLYPKKSLVKNHGFDGTGTHCGIKTNDSTVYDKTFQVINFPEIVTEYPNKDEIFKCLKNHNSNSGFKLYDAIFRKIKKFF